MNLYRFNKKTLTYSKFWVPPVYLIPAVIIIFIAFAFSNQEAPKAKTIEYEQIPIIFDQTVNSNFSPKELYSYIKSLNIRCPKVVMCQAINETRFSSTVFVKNHNVFNMKAAKSRPNLQIGYENDHATFRNWKESVVDYAIWQAFCINSNVKSDEDYFNFLVQAHFASGESYISSLRDIYNSFDKTLNTYQRLWEEGKLNNSDLLSSIQKTDSLLNK